MFEYSMFFLVSNKSLKPMCTCENVMQFLFSMTNIYTWDPLSRSRDRLKAQVKRIRVAQKYASKLQKIPITLDIPLSRSQDHPKVQVKRICRSRNSAKNITRLVHFISLFLFHKISQRCEWRGYVGLESQCITRNLRMTKELL